MARLAFQAKAGFYPTPDNVVFLLKTKISFEKDARSLGPCCRYENTLSRLASHDTITYGIELDHQRATKAKSQLFKAVWSVALTEARIPAA